MRPKLAQILHAVELAYDLPPRTLYQRTRLRQVCRKRWVAWWIAREITRMSYPEIAIHHGQMHHTSVIHGVRWVDRQMATDAALHGIVTGIMQRWGWLQFSK